MSRMPEIVTIDGPAGVGKSTLAARVAGALDFAYLDTGAMFRTVALSLVKAGLSPDDDLEKARDIDDILEDLVFSLQGAGRETRLICNGKAVGDEIRSEEAGMMAAQVGRSPRVRAYLKRAQQHLGGLYSLVAEGRDMGTVVFPGALCKFFLDASPEVRAERRCRQLREMGQNPDPELLARQVRERDEQDRNRPVAPLKPAADGLIVDTSHMDIEAVFAAIVSAVEEARGQLPPMPAMRRKDRALSLDDSLDLLRRAEYGILGLDEGSGWPYALPLSFVYADGVVYVHCAREGRKVEALRNNSRVCFTVVGDTEPVYAGNFSTYFESVMVFGPARLVEDDEEKYRALWLLAEKYLPAHMDKAHQDIRHSFSRTALYRIAPRFVSGKAKSRKAHG